MLNQFPHEAAVLAAVRTLFAVGLYGHEEAEAMARLFTETSLLPLKNLDVWEGKIRTELWAMQKEPGPRPLKLWKEPPRFAIWLNLCSGDGFTRERSLRSLSEGAPNGFFCSLALRRLNDWVPQVRAAARQNIPQMAERSDPEHVVDALWNTLTHCVWWGRMENADREVLADLLSIKHVAVALKSRIMQATSGPAAEVLSQAGRACVLDAWLDEFARNAIQPSVRAKAYRCLLEGRMVWLTGRKWRWTDLKWCKGRFESVFGERAIPECRQVPAILRTAMVDRSPLVRRVAADFLIQQPGSIGADASILAEQIASDSCAYVAERGRCALAMLAGHA